MTKSRLETLRFVSVLTSILVFAAGLCLILRASTFKTTWQSNTNFLANDRLRHATIGIVFGSLVTSFAMVGIVASFMKNYIMLVCYSICLGLLSLGMSFYAAVMYIHNSSDLGSTFVAVTASINNLQPMDLDLVQTKFHCCGIEKYTDYLRIWSLWDQNATYEAIRNFLHEPKQKSTVSTTVKNATTPEKLPETTQVTPTSTNATKHAVVHLGLNLEVRVQPRATRRTTKATTTPTISTTPTASATSTAQTSTTEESFEEFKAAFESSSSEDDVAEGKDIFDNSVDAATERTLNVGAIIIEEPGASFVMSVAGVDAGSTKTEDIFVEESTSVRETTKEFRTATEGTTTEEPTSMATENASIGLSTEEVIQTTIRELPDNRASTIESLRENTTFVTTQTGKEPSNTSMSSEATRTVESNGTSSEETAHFEPSSEETHSEASTEATHSEASMKVTYSEASAEMFRSKPSSEVSHSEATRQSEASTEMSHSKPSLELTHSEASGETYSEAFSEVTKVIHPEASTEVTHLKSTTNVAHSEASTKTNRSSMVVTHDSPLENFEPFVYIKPSSKVIHTNASSEVTHSDASSESTWKVTENSSAVLTTLEKNSSHVIARGGRRRRSSNLMTDDSEESEESEEEEEEEEDEIVVLKKADPKIRVDNLDQSMIPSSQLPNLSELTPDIELFSSYLAMAEELWRDILPTVGHPLGVICTKIWGKECKDYEGSLQAAFREWIAMMFAFIYEYKEWSMNAPGMSLKWWFGSGWDLMLYRQLSGWTATLPTSCCKDQQESCNGRKGNTWMDGCKQKLRWYWKVSHMQYGLLFVCFLGLALFNLASVFVLLRTLREQPNPL